MLPALVGGSADPEMPAELARGRLRKNIPALKVRVIVVRLFSERKSCARAARRWSIKDQYSDREQTPNPHNQT